MNPEEEDTEEEDDYEPAFVDASAADVTVHLDLNETDEPPPPDDDDDDLDEEEEEDLEEEDGVMMEEDVAVEDRDAADESVLRPEKDECEMKMEERKGSIFAVAWATTTKRDDGEGGSVEREVMCAGGSDDRANFDLHTALPWPVQPKPFLQLFGVVCLTLRTKLIAESLRKRKKVGA